MKLRGGAAKLTGFEAQLGRKRSDNRLADFGIREHDGALVYNAQHIFGHLRLEQELAQLAEVVCRMLEAEAAGQAVDLLAVLARNVVAQARSTFCCCCGRLLTDPVSVDSGIGPERGEAFQVAFRRQWQAARETRA